MSALTNEAIMANIAKGWKPNYYLKGDLIAANAAGKAVLAAAGNKALACRIPVTA